MNEQLVLQFLLLVIGITLVMVLIMPGDDGFGLFGLTRNLLCGSVALVMGLLFFWRKKPPSLLKLGLLGAAISWMIHTKFPVDLAQVLPKGSLSSVPIVNHLVAEPEGAPQKNNPPKAIAQTATKLQPGQYRVRCVPPFDGLHLRSAPNDAVILTMPCQATPVTITGAGVEQNGVVWVPVEYAGQKGWSVQSYLEQMQGVQVSQQVAQP